MPLTPGPDTLICSARECTHDAVNAVVWSNPKIHYGRHKTWLACEEHTQTLLEYLKHRGFPAEVKTLDEIENDSTSD
ncbi:hypothetical protein FYJ24_04015 [Actinomycetaceae bacterium WB03_NA08]|uniref:Acetone carboxylase n=1 Tax=Scrofimicrobium canadense TaxID=2652290 RepID=A0A6N7W685_9ACTO|nr:hypothetical protein [Scrofimicrobium canadense]MSS83942.1 hypothetical protein [Scrofimicrobium canadense]